MVHTNSGWEQGLADRLSQEPDLEVYRVTYMSESSFLGHLTRIQPDVILLNKDALLHPHQLRGLLASMPTQSPVRIIVLNDRNNVVDIYDSLKQRQVVVTRFADLINCIRGAQRV